MKKKLFILGLGAVVTMTSFGTVLANNTEALPVSAQSAEQKGNEFQKRLHLNEADFEERFAKIAEAKGLTIEEIKEQFEERGNRFNGGENEASTRRM
ncbi:hypothetical protein BKP37_01330 [Anaerobacillus alkalilacustris]|uniref:Uncharacterized protein n=1 Tax=Anaerobacillus alkalilacustris TaxID=393763 RepID=A0A1S2LXG2_9BACI|nr:hypothetical protein [Anaerobacillus alkalilacustris]OIJ17201.1 hypothetical protein BKP37_01330 [Anaerobacillus alkalilacustris]